MRWALVVKAANRERRVCEKRGENNMKAYHFTGTALRNGAPLPAIGEWLVHEGKIVPCESGLHASTHPFDALKYAPGVFLHQVELEGDLTEHHGDKWVGRRRKIIKSIDATELLREFSRWCALQVVYLWDAPPVVKEYLETGNQTLRPIAEDAAWATEGTAAGAAVRDDAWYAAEAAVCDALRDDACDAAEAAACDAVRAIAMTTAEPAARTAATTIAEAATRGQFQRLVDTAFAA